jgi:hypothetical protein
MKCPHHLQIRKRANKDGEIHHKCLHCGVLLEIEYGNKEAKK